MTSRFSVEELSGPIVQTVLRDAEAGSEVRIAQSRGALATRFFDGKRELLFLDEPSFLDTTKNVRGGIPVLFPSPGKLENDRWARDGKSGSLKQHGFARNTGWKFVGTQTNDHAALTLHLESSTETLANYPWPFAVDLTFSLLKNVLRIEIKVANTGTEPMPYGFGFHPYFLADFQEKEEASIDTNATRAWDNVEKRERPIAGSKGIQLGGPEVDLHLIDHNRTDSALTLPSGKISLKGSDAFQRWVIWTQPGKDFICLEPWTGPGNGLNSGEGLRTLAPGKDETLWLEIFSD